MRSGSTSIPARPAPAATTKAKSRQAGSNRQKKLTLKNLNKGNPCDLHYALRFTGIPGPARGANSTRPPTLTIPNSVTAVDERLNKLAANERFKRSPKVRSASCCASAKNSIRSKRRDHRAPPGRLAGRRVARLREQLVSGAHRSEWTARPQSLPRADVFAPDAPQSFMVSPLADGADQVAAEIGLELGLRLHAILPFGRTTIARACRRGAAATLRRAARPSRMRARTARRAHTRARRLCHGRARHGRPLRHADRGVGRAPPRGRGGTAEVVELAITRGTPVIHVPVDRRATGAAAVERVRPRRADPARRPDGRARRSTPAHLEQMLDGAAAAAARPAGARTSFELSAASGCGGSGRGSNIRCCSRWPA